MTYSDWYLFCFAVGFLWCLIGFLMGSFHSHAHIGHSHSHLPHAPHADAHAKVTGAGSQLWENVFSVSGIAIFLVWFGGCGYLLSRHSALVLPAVIFISLSAGAVGAVTLGSFLRLLHAKEYTMDASDYEMTGVLGRVSSAILPGGTGEILFTRDGARKLACARSEDGARIEQGVEVVVTHYDQGIAYVRTWDSMAGDIVSGNENEAAGRDRVPRPSTESERLA